MYQPCVSYVGRSYVLRVRDVIPLSENSRVTDVRTSRRDMGTYVGCPTIDPDVDTPHSVHLKQKTGSSSSTLVATRRRKQMVNGGCEGHSLEFMSVFGPYW